MAGLVFENQAPVIASAPNRADIVCFIGFVRRRPTALTPAVRRWLAEQGWPEARGRAAVADLLDVPTPIDTWDVFDRLFEWESRPLSTAGERATTYLGAAVRTF